MTLYIEQNNTFVEWIGQEISGVRYPLDIETWSDADLLELNLYKPQEADEIPEGKVSTGMTVQRVNGIVKFVHTLEDVLVSTNPVDYPLLPWQFKAMVLYLNKKDAIQTAIDTISDDLERAVAQSRYENASSYVYDDPLMQSIRIAVGLSEEDLTSAWMIAKDL